MHRQLSEVAPTGEHRPAMCDLVIYCTEELLQSPQAVLYAHMWHGT